MLTPQEIFDTVTAHLLRQNAQALVGGKCSYRAPNGKKCAAGVLIEDEFYNASCEGGSTGGYSAASDNAINALRLSGINIHVDLFLVHNLQHVHDHWQPDEWARQLGNIAVRFQLDTFILRCCLHKFGQP